jgi:CDP-glucose 4,6-dehydratase
MLKLFGRVFKDRTVLITGHTGFKGSWLAFWLDQMGANIIGYSLPPPTQPNHFDLLDLDITSVTGDIRDLEKLNDTVKRYQPEIVFHLAAQPLVRSSYENPIETYETNVIGTLKVFETCRKHNVRAVVNVTSDKCYENKEWIWGYRENDPMGGFDPYSSSKGCAELLTSSYRNSYFPLLEYKKTHHTLIASCRAGNVIGGGDWAKDRLIPDIILAACQGKITRIRNPQSVRPWQHVLEPLSGYLQIGQTLLEEKPEFAGPWNFGPGDRESITVQGVAELMKEKWDRINYDIERDPNQVHEANLLLLDSTKSRTLLKWQNIWESAQAIDKTVNWYKTYHETDEVCTKPDLQSYVRDAKKKNLEWTG